MQGGGQQQQQQQSQQQQQQQQQQRRRKSKAETPDWASSGTSTPGGGDWTSESGSYDPANDSDLDHIDFMPGETDGLPANAKKKKGAEEEDAQPKGWARIRGLMFGKGDEDEAGKAEAQTASSPTSRPYEEVQRGPQRQVVDERRAPDLALLTVPGYSIALSIRNQAKVTRKEFPVMVAIAIAGWATNHFAAQSKSLSQRSDVTSALGAMAVGLLSNVFGRIYDGKSYTVACVGVLYQLPSGLSGGGGLLSFANDQNNSAANISSGFSVAQSLVEVALGLTVGLYAATVIAYIVGGRKIRGGGLFSF
ncbi:hypothetical protein L7F22_027031 [Adiantum nelumboides]|nr:hypothetical protein [Adiantum nelumboides]